MTAASEGVEAELREPLPGSLMLLLMGIAMLGSLATHLVVPSLPQLQREFSTDYGTVQLLVSLFVIAYGASQIVAGPLADAYGRRRMLITGLSVFTGASLLCAVAANLETLILFRILQGSSACFGLVMARALIRDISAGRNASALFGYLAVGTSVGSTLAPLFGGHLYQSFGWSGPFWFMAAFSLAGLALAIRLVPETVSTATGWASLRRMPSDFAGLLRQPSFLIHSGNISINTALFYSFIVGGALVSNRDLHLSPAEYGLWFSMTAVGYAMGNVLSGRAGQRYSARPTIVVGAVAVLASMLAMALLDAWVERSPLTFFLPMTGVTLSSGLIMSNSMAGGMALDPRRSGSASGLLGFLQFAAAALFSFIAGHVAQVSQSALILLMLALAVSGLANATIVRPATN
ncbi:multidrug effflux MFS transporter [Neorhizobium sp. SOG26]|uniref:multidrug effflux MFS transporter n=1 Tax=Neorhizobium sp. SOG26 TaxID=2060726 RepID=UPI0019025055|nr:multidrug effflux MFS transporter [Neorhizobium sp. SOG26]